MSDNTLLHEVGQSSYKDAINKIAKKVDDIISDSKTSNGYIYIIDVARLVFACNITTYSEDETTLTIFDISNELNTIVNNCKDSGFDYISAIPISVTVSDCASNYTDQPVLIYPSLPDVDGSFGIRTAYSGSNTSVFSSVAFNIAVLLIGFKI